MKRAVLLLGLVACNDNDFVVRPLVDFPTNEAASPYPIDQLTVSVAHAGSEIDLVSATFLHDFHQSVAGRNQTAWAVWR